MPTKQGGKFRRQNGKLERVTKPAEQQRYGAHAEHPSKHKAKAPAAAPAKAPSSAKTSTNVKGTDDADATT